jgi:hypothetical protein
MPKPFSRVQHLIEFLQSPEYVAKVLAEIERRQQAKEKQDGKADG